MSYEVPTPGPPAFIAQLHTTRSTYNRGDTIVMEASVRGNPQGRKVNFTWNRSYTDGDLQSLRARWTQETSPGGKIRATISNAKPNDSGTFTATVETPMYSSVSSSCSVYVP